MSTLYISFPKPEARPIGVCVSETTPLAEHEQIWAWDHFFALVYHKLEDDALAKQLMEDLLTWAANAAGKIYSTETGQANYGLDELNAGIQLEIEPATSGEGYKLSLSTNPEGWPEVHVGLPEHCDPQRLVQAVYALAKYFLTRNVMFARELPLHIMSLNKYYTDQLGRKEADSVAAAPAYAFNATLKLYQDLNKKMGLTDTP